MQKTAEYICGNTPLTEAELNKAKQIINNLQKENEEYIEKGYGPFRAAIYDKSGKMISSMSNTVALDNCCLCHAEVNTIREAHRVLKTYNLAPYNLDIYVTAEPCVMCMGAIMWSGIKRVFFSVNSKDVENITGFDEGFKPDWIDEFAKRGIEVYGEIEVEEGIRVLKKYVETGKVIYKPE